MPVEILVEDDNWDVVNLTELVEAAHDGTLTHLGLDPKAHEVSLLACDDARIAQLNGQFRDKPTPTNVLSWPSMDLLPDEDGAQPDVDDAPSELGDVALAFGTCAREAEAAGRPFEQHVTHLVVHGTLHLLGYDHIRDKDATLMEALEVAILDELGVPDPYLLDRGSVPDDGMN